MKTSIEDFLNSLRAVTVPMLLLIVSFSIKLSALFYDSFEIQVEAFKIAASILMAIAASLTLLTVSVNSQLFNTNKFPLIFAICTGIIMLFVFKVIGEQNYHWSEYVKRIFLSIFLAITEYVYSKLFIRKYNENKDTIQLQEEHKELQLDYHRTLTELGSTKDELQENSQELNKTKVELDKFLKEFSCKHCGHIEMSKSNLKKHAADCIKNPRNQNHEL